MCGRVHASGDSLIQVMGIVVDSLTREALPYAYCINVSQRIGTISNLDGSFSIVVKDGDTLLFSYMGYKSRSIVVDLLEIGERRNLTIYMRVELVPDTIVLPEVVVYPWKTAEEFRQAFLNWEPPVIEAPYTYYHLSPEVIKELAENSPPTPQALFLMRYQAEAYSQYAYRQFPYVGAFNPIAWAKWLQLLEKYRKARRRR